MQYVSEIKSGNIELNTFTYGPEHQRVRQNVTLSGNGTSSYVAGNTWYLNGEDVLDLAYEKEVRAKGMIEE